MIGIIDYDAGNIMSVQKAITHLGEEPFLSRDPELLMKADKLILPGVGSFGESMERIRRYGLEDMINDYIRKGDPFLGICLGLQLIFDESEESPGVKGLGLIKGRIRKIPVGEYTKIPHMGWNSLAFPREGRLFKGIDEGEYVYFVHSYYLDTLNKEDVAATTDYNVTIDASVEHDNIFACQFHPEKSGNVGLKILDNFIRL